MSHAVGTRRDSAHTLRAPHLDAYPHALRQSRPWAWREDASSRTPYRLSLWLRPLCLRRNRVSWPQGPGLRTDAALSSFPRPQVAHTYWTVFDAASKRDGAGAAGSHGDIATLTLRRSPHALDSARSQNRCGERRARRRGLRRARVRRRSERRYGARRAWLCPPLTPGERGGVEREMDRGGGDCSRRRQRRTGTKRRGSTSPTCRIPRVSARLVVRLKEERCAR